MSANLSDEKGFGSQLQRIVVFFAIAFIGLGYILNTLPGVPEESKGCALDKMGHWKLALILTHILAFVLIPLAMKVFYEALTALDSPKSAIFASQLGLSFIMVSIASEIGWHVTQCWYYQDQFTMLNFMFYFFLLSAFALWGDGLTAKNTWVTQLLNILFALSLVVVSILYSVGSMRGKILPDGSMTGDPNYKIPIYIALTLIFSVLTYRGWKLLEDKRIILFPIFSVGVNLFFVFLLQYHGKEIAYNALFHILHDLAGTETGVAIFTWLVYLKGREARLKETNEPAISSN